MMAEVMSAFGYTTEYILWKWSIPQFFLWYDMAIWKNYGSDYKVKWTNDSEPQTADEINAMFTKDVENNRWM